MPELWELGKRLLGGLRPSPITPSRGEPAILTGAHAVAWVEERVGVQPRPLAVAVGEAMSGLRASAWLDGPELAGAHELLAWAAGRSLPLVVHARLRGGPGHAEACGTGHEGWHAVADAGCVMLMAANAQEALDLTVVARLVAETTLLPVILGQDADQVADSAQSVQLPEDELLGLLGSPEDEVDCPTAAQVLFFGRQRRRLPRWHDLDRPALHGAAQGRRSWALGAAAREPYLHRPVAGLVARAMLQVGGLTARRLGALSSTGDPNARKVLVAQGSAVELAAALTPTIPLAVVGVRCFRPFPSTELRSRLSKHEVLVLERVSGDLARHAPLRREVEGLVHAPVGSLFGGAGGHPLRLADLEAACLQPTKDRAWVGIDFMLRSSPHPTQQAHLDALKRAFPEAAGAPGGAPPTSAPKGLALGLPPELVGSAARLVQMLLGGTVRCGIGWLWWSAKPGAPGDSPPLQAELAGDTSEVLAGLLAWMGQHGLQWSERELARSWAELGLEPVEAGSLPIRRAVEELPGRRAPMVLRALGDDDAPDSVRRFWGSVGLPFLAGNPLVPDPMLAVGAIPPLTSTFHDQAPGRARLPEFDPDPCTGCGDCWVACPEGALGVLAVSNRDLVDFAARTGPALKPVAGKLAKALRKAPGPDAGVALRAAGAAVVAALPEERRAAAETALDDGARRLEGLRVAAPWPEDLLLSLVIDPAACTGCGSCAKACQTPALVAAAQTPERVALARRAWEIWEDLPDTKGVAMQTLAPRIGPLAARLLTRSCALALAGGNGREPGSGAKLVLRAALAMTEASLQPQQLRQLSQLKELRSALDAAVRDELAGAMPAGSELATALDGGALEAVSLTPKDRSRLRRRVQLSQDLAELEQLIKSGSRGLARARVGVVLEPSLAARWGVEFPYNPFQAPTVVAGAGQAVELGVGLLKGHLSQVGQGQDLLLRAAEELGKPAVAGLKPPVLVVGDDSLLREQGLREVLDEGLPLKLLVVVEQASSQDLTLLDLRRHGAFVGQGAVGDPDDLAELLLKAMKHPGPAVLRVHAPSPDPEHTDAAIPRSAEVVKSGGWPLWSLGPEQSLRDLEPTGGPLDQGVLYELGRTASLEKELRAGFEEREAALRAELAEQQRAMKADEESRFQARLEERLLALAGLLEPS